MTPPRRTTSSSRSRAFSPGWLDPSSAWALDEYAVIPPIASEPYDWTPEDDAIPPPQFIPIPPPILDGSARLRQARRKADLSEASALIPLENLSPDQLAGKNRTRPRRRHLISSLLLLLLSVIALFVFAYVAQKHGR